jgi:outer membrane immunogenic protein
MNMKKALLALTALAAFTGSAVAADLGARPYTKAPAPVAPVYNWTGFYIFGGGGGGLWDADSNVQSTGVASPIIGGLTFGPAGTALTRDQRVGGDGWFGTVGIGYDWQFNRWVAGVFADGQFGELKGSMSDPFFGIEGRVKLRTSYAAGARIGYLVAPQVLSYVNAGYSGSEWSGSSLTDLAAGGSGTIATTPSFRRDGWFIGGGVENNLDFFGISAPGWFMKTEYRSAFYDRISLPETFAPASGFAGLTGTATTFKPWVQTISTSLVYRFNWGGAPIQAKY